MVDAFFVLYSKTMKQASTLLSTIVILLTMLILHTSNASAKLYMGKITMQVGETRSVEAVPPISAYTASGSFSKTGTCVAITANGSYTCEIKANYVGTGTLSYWGAVARSNTWTTETYDMYWDVEVKGNDESSGSSSGSNTEEFDEVQEPTDDWGKSGNYSISWYNKNKTEFTISTNKELAGMAYLINNGYTTFENCTIKLANDIDLSDKKWLSCKTFNGKFDGQGHRIYGIFIGTNEDTQISFGFWRTLSNAIVTNLHLDGTAKYYVKKRSDENVFAGGLAGKVSSNSIIQNCIVNVNVYFKRGAVSAHYTLWGSDRIQESSYVGGIAGNLEGEIKKCINLGSIRYFARENWIPQGVHMGGIAGYSGYGYYQGKIEYCENLSPLFKVVENNVGSTGENFIKFINGISFGGELLCCCSIIEEIYADVTSHKGTTTLYLSGIGVGGTTTNCYSVISRMNIKTKNSDPSINYGGISANSIDRKNLNPIACFCNNDVYIARDDSKTVGEGQHGSNAFSSEQMRTAAFLEELNMYPMLEMDGAIWAQDSDGGYPYIAELYQITPVIAPKAKETVSEQSFYNLSGQRLDKPRKGINIIGGKKVMVK